MIHRRSAVSYDDDDDDDDYAEARLARLEAEAAIEEAVARGVERGAVNVVATAAEVYLVGGCMLMLVKAAGWVLLGLVVLVLVLTGH
jgi:hypothetical protein